jgi:leader peptidase (prepilin peptidase)/N-methyltransferase
VNILTVEYLIVLVWLFTLGTVFGSMLNVGIYRLPREERFWQALRFMVYPPSHCPRCGERIKVYDNIPILGWLRLCGRCRNCRGTISIRYPLIEFLTGLLFVVVYCFEVPAWWGGFDQSSVHHIFGPTGWPNSSWMTPLMMLHWRYAVHMLLVIALVVATFIDIDLRIIPDAVTLPAMAVGVVANCALGQVSIVPVWYQTPDMAFAAGNNFLLIQALVPPGGLQNMLLGWMAGPGVPAWIPAHPHWHGLVMSLAGIIVGGGSIWAVRIVGQWALKREAMGFGDVVLMAMIGSFIGWQGTLIVFVLALLSAVVVALPQWYFRRDHELPYGPYLALGTLLLLVSARQVWPWFDSRIFAMGPLLVPMAVFMTISLGGMLFVWRGIQKRLGLAPVEPDPMPEAQWLAGDQLAYMAGECNDDRQGQWRRPEWPGRPAGRGQIHYEAWRH